MKAALPGEQPLRGDDDVDGSRRHPLEHRVGLLAGAEARQALDAHRPVGEAVDEGGVVLLRQQRGGHQHGHLPAGLHGDEGGAQGYLGLAEAHIAANHPVHGLVGLHVGDDLSMAEA